MTSINLSNLAKIGQLEPVALSVDLVKRMLAAAKQRLRDAEFTQNSAETRFDCAYTTIRAVADIGLHLHGFRTSTSKPAFIISSTLALMRAYSFSRSMVSPIFIGVKFLFCFSPFLSSE